MPTRWERVHAIDAIVRAEQNLDANVNVGGQTFQQLAVAFEQTFARSAAK